MTKIKCPVFICYRQVDGTKIAQWLFKNLNGQRLPDIGHVETEEKVSSLDVYFDQRAPAVSDWKAIHQPRLRTSQAMIIVCTPGSFQKLEKDDWVHLEIDWWLKNRKVAPILIDATGEGERWVPKVINDRWKDAQRITVVQDDLLRLQGQELRSFEEQVRSRILNGIVLSKQRVFFEDLERQKKMSRRLKITLVVALILAGLAGWQWQRAKKQTRIAQERLQVSRSRELAAQAVNQAKFGRVDLALLLSREAYKVRPTLEARSALLTSLTHSPNLMGFLHDHRTAIISVALSSDGSKMASSSVDGTIIIWDMITRQRIGQPLLDINGGLDMVFHPDGTKLVTGGCAEVSQTGTCEKGKISFWDLNTMAIASSPLHAHNSVVTSLAFGENGALLASAGADGQIILWDFEKKQPIGEPILAHDNPITDIIFESSGDLLASSSKGEIRFWDVKSRQEKGMPIQGHDGWIRTISFDWLGEKLASGGDDGEVRLWDLDTRQQFGEPLVGHTNVISNLTFIPASLTTFMNDAIVSGSYDQTLIMWDTETQQKIGNPLIGHTDKVTTLDFSSDKQMIVSGGNDGKVIIWDIQPGALAKMIQGPVLPAWGVDISPDGKLLATGGDDDAISLWNVESLQRIGEPMIAHKGDVTCVAFNPNGLILASGSDDGSIIIWDVASRQQIRRLVVSQYSSVKSVAFNSTGSILASGSSEGGVLLWDINSDEDIGQPLSVDPTLAVESIAFSPVDSILASGEGGGIVLWDLTSQKSDRLQVQRKGSSVLSVAFSPDGKILASGDTDGKITLWNMATRRQLTQPLTYHTDWVTCIRFSPDGRIMASGSQDKTIILLDLDTLQPFPQRLKNHTLGSVRALDFTPDSRFLVSVSWESMIQLWDVSEESWLMRTCRTANRNLTFDESRLYQDSIKLTCNDLGIHPSFSDEIIRLAQAGEIERSLTLLKNCSKIDPNYVVPISVLNSICWWGCLSGKASAVLETCQEAVHLSDSSIRGNIRDSRGLARALTGDYQGAIEDFTAFVKWSHDSQQYEHLRKKRIAWIKSLKSGKNPFDDQTLEELRKE